MNASAVPRLMPALVHICTTKLLARNSASILAQPCLSIASATSLSFCLNFQLALIPRLFYVLLLSCVVASFHIFLSLENPIFTSLFAFPHLLLQGLHFKVEVTNQSDKTLKRKRCYLIKKLKHLTGNFWIKSIQHKRHGRNRTLFALY